VPLSQIATISEVMEEPIIWRRSRTPNLTVRADLVEGVQAPDISAQLGAPVAALAAEVPPGTGSRWAGLSRRTRKRRHRSPQACR
jgi:multidrug efflux pump